jgi:HEAT repeat protein
VLSHLAQDPVWLVRLRAVVSLGKLEREDAVGPLLEAVGESNRLVRLRAAEGLIRRKADDTQVFAKVVAKKDRYALYAYLAALDNAGLGDSLRNKLQADSSISETKRNALLEILKTDILPVELAPQAALAHAAAKS